MVLFPISLALGSLLRLLGMGPMVPVYYFAFVFTYACGMASIFFSEWVRVHCNSCSNWAKGSLYCLSFLLSGLAGTSLALPLYHLGYSKLPFSADLLHFYFTCVFFTVWAACITQLFYFTRGKLIDTFQQLKKTELEERNMRELKIKAELAALRAAVDPHFLFNALNSVAALISTHPKRAEDALHGLSDFYRHTLRASRAQQVTLAEELDGVRHYLNIQKLRFGERLEYGIERDAPSDSLKIPPMTIQPLVENSIKHGVSQSVAGGRIDIRAERVDGWHRILVSDTGRDGSGVAGEGFGLKSVRERLALTFGDGFAMRIWKDKGFHVELKIQEAENA